MARENKEKKRDRELVVDVWWKREEKERVLGRWRVRVVSWVRGRECGMKVIL